MINKLEVSSHAVVAKLIIIQAFFWKDRETMKDPILPSDLDTVNSHID
jgi:hypothetical protein